jgi:hypothetical protein
VRALLGRVETLAPGEYINLRGQGPTGVHLWLSANNVNGLGVGVGKCGLSNGAVRSMAVTLNLESDAGSDSSNTSFDYCGSPI